MGISIMRRPCMRCMSPCMGDSSKVSLGMPEGAGTMPQIFDFQFKRYAGWLNDTLGMRLQKVEDTASGAVACQIMDVLHPGVVPIKKVVSKGCPQRAPPQHGNHSPSSDPHPLPARTPQLFTPILHLALSPLTLTPPVRTSTPRTSTT